MPTLSVRDLATITAARLHLADLPPLLGALEAVTTIHFTLDSLETGSLFWTLDPADSSASLRAELSFMQGASGLLLDSRHVEPWAGRYTLRVSNSRLALRHLAAYLRGHRTSQVIAITPRLSRDPTCHFLQAILDQPPKMPPWHPATVPLAAPASTTLIKLTDPITAHGSAALLLTGPNFLLTGHGDPFLTNHCDRHGIHQLLESLLPNGRLVFTELLNLTGLPHPMPESDLPNIWTQALAEADIELFRIGTSRLADLRITATHDQRGQTSLEVDDFSLPYTAATFPDAVARLTAYGVGRLLGQQRAALARRLNLQHLPPFRRAAA
ncbi:MAG: hypothetical protein ABGX05_02745 [Pirellulaceae bacterium]